MSEGVLPGGHRYKIERTNPERDARNLALRMGDALRREQVARLNADFYTREARRINQEVTQLETVLDRVRRRDSGELVEFTSRMDPLRTYSAAAIQRQIRCTAAKVEKFNDIAKRHMQEAIVQRKEHDAAAQELQTIREEMNGL